MRIKELRFESGKTQVEIADNLGISRQVFANYEKEINFPDPNMLIKLARYFNVTVDYLIGNEEQAKTVESSAVNITGLTDKEREILMIFRGASESGKNIILGNARNVEKNDPSFSKKKQA